MSNGMASLALAGALLTASVFVYGAGAKPSASPGKADPDMVIVSVNGAEITRRMVERQADMMVALLRNRRRVLSPEMAARFRSNNLKPISDELFRRTIISTVLAGSNVVASAAARAKIEQECVRNLGKKGQAFGDIRALMEKTGFVKEFDFNVDVDARLQEFVTTVHSNEYYVSEEKFAKVKADVAEYNARAAATNKLALAHAQSVLRRARSGEDFGKLADEFSEDPEKEKGGALGDCDESDFSDDKHVWRAISELPAGSVSDVLDTDDGYAIFKVVRRNTVEESETGDASLTLARIFFRRAYVFPPQADADLRDDVEQELRAKLLADVYKAFREQSRIVYPNGPVKAKQ